MNCSLNFGVPFVRKQSQTGAVLTGNRMCVCFMSVTSSQKIPVDPPQASNKQRFLLV